MRVCKFGGSSLADAAQIKKVCKIMLAEPERRIVVVSAPGKRYSGDAKVTDLLIVCAEAAIAGSDAETPLARVIARFAGIVEELGLPNAVLREVEFDLRTRLASSRSNDGRFMDLMKAAGEANSARIVTAAFAKFGAAAVCVDPGKAGMLLKGDCGDAMLIGDSYALLNHSLTPLLDRADKPIIVFPGFFGARKDGSVATFPRGGSDITGAILAAAVRAERYENWTDVDTVYVVDPRVVPEVSHGIKSMTYREMRELAYAGFGVFHDEAVMPAFQAGIPIEIRNTNHPEVEGTWILPKKENKTCTVTGIASDEGFMSVFVERYMMNREIGFGRKLLQILEEEHVSFEHMPSGVDSISIVLRSSRCNNDQLEKIITRIKNELQPDTIYVHKEQAIIMVVGEGMRYAVGIASRVLKALAAANINIELLNQGASELSIMLGIKAADRAEAIRALYAEFFDSGKRA